MNSIICLWNPSFYSQGDVRRHCQHLLLSDARPVDEDRVPEVALPGVYGLPLQEPQGEHGD